MTIVSDLLKLPEPKQTKTVTRGPMMLLNHLSSQEIIQLLEEKKREKGKRGRRKRAMLSRERAEEKKKQKEQKKEYDKQNAETASIRIRKKKTDVCSLMYFMMMIS